MLLKILQLSFFYGCITFSMDGAKRTDTTISFFDQDTPSTAPDAYVLLQKKMKLNRAWTFADTLLTYPVPYKSFKGILDGSPHFPLIEYMAKNIHFHSLIIKKLTEENDPQSLYNLGMVYYYLDHFYDYIDNKYQNENKLSPACKLAQKWWETEPGKNSLPKFLQQADDELYPKAQYALAEWYSIKESIQFTAPYYKKSAHHHCPEAQTKLALYYAHPTNNCNDPQCNNNNAFDLCKKAGDQGYAEAFFLLGNAFSNAAMGVVSKDAKMAFNFYLKAAERGLEDAINKVINIYWSQQKMKDAQKWEKIQTDQEQKEKDLFLTLSKHSQKSNAKKRKSIELKNSDNSLKSAPKKQKKPH